MVAIHTEYERHQKQIRQLVAQVSAGVDPFDHLADFAPPSEVDLLRARVARQEVAMRLAMEQLKPAKKATKDVLLGKIQCAREELARVLENENEA